MRAYEKVVRDLEESKAMRWVDTAGRQRRYYPMMGESPRARIAVINDDTAFLSLMHELLQEEESYDVLICREWDHAYEFVKREHPDLLILDIRIGGEEHGWTILNLLTLDAETRPIPTIVCSAAIQSLDEHQPMLTRFGIRALPKPFDLDTLLEAIERMIPDSGQDGGNATPPES